MNNNFSITGYKDNSPDKNRSHNIIPGNLITMKGVSKPLTLVPIINGKPDYGKKIVANPGDDDIQFDSNVEGVLELPFAQSAWGMINPQMFQNTLYPVNNLNNAINNAGTSYMDNANLNYNNPYLGAQSLPSMTNAPMNNQKPPAYVEPTVDINGQYNSRLNTMEMGQYGTMQMDPNEIQKHQANQTEIDKQVKEQQRKNTPFIGAINPYGGWNMSNTATMLGASIQDKNVLGTVASSGKLLLSGFRNAMTGASAMKKFNESRDEYEDRLQKEEYKQGWHWLQKGGSVGKLLTGNFIEGQENLETPSAEVEKGEYLQTPDGSSMEVLGKKHSEGGELMNLPNGTKVISDYLKIGSKLATYFKKEYGLNTVASNTFATVLDKYKKKIGLTDLIEDESKLMNKLNDQEDVEFEGTRDINLQVLSEKIYELQPQKNKLEDRFNTFTNIVYEKQEATKEPGQQNFEKQTGGIVDSEQEPETTNDEGQPIPQEANSTDAELEQIIIAYAEMTQTNPQEIIQQLQNMDDTSLQEAVQQMIQVIQQSQQAVNSSEQQEMQVGGMIFDEGYLNVRPPISPFEYIAQQIRQGKSVLGGVEKDGEILDPGSEKSMEEILIRAESLAKYDPQYKEQFEKLKSDLSSAKTSKERFNVLNTYGQKERQQFFRNSFNDEIAGYVGMGYAPTETQLLNTYKNLTGDSKKEFESLLKKDGISIKNNKVVIPGGFYKNSANYNQDSDLYKFYDALKTTNPTVYNKLGIDNITDGVWDRRAETIHSAEFESVKARDEYGQKQGFKSFTNTNGDLVWIDPNNRNNLIIPKVYRDKKVTPEELKKYIDNKELSDKEGYKNFGDRNVYERWVTEVESSDLNPPKNKNGIDPMGNLDREWDNGLPMLVPDQSNLPPTYLATTLRQVGHVQANPIKISPEETIKELNRQYNVASELTSEVNPYTSGAAQANLQAQTNNAINQAYSQAAIANAQDQRNVENINEERIQQRDNTNIGMMDRYEKEQISGLDNYIKEWRSYIDKNNLEQVNNWNLTNEQMAFNAVNDNFKIGSMGWYQTDEQPIIYYESPTGDTIAYNRQTKQSQIVSKSYPDGTKAVNKTETTPKKQKGGLLLSKNIKNWLK